VRSPGQIPHHGCEYRARALIFVTHDIQMPLRLTIATLMLDVVNAWTLNALLMRSSSYRRCSKRRILDHSGQATSLLPIEDTTSGKPATCGFGFGSSTGFVAGPEGVAEVLNVCECISCFKLNSGVAGCHCEHSKPRVKGQ
jgi:hypothetical protein